MKRPVTLIILDGYGYNPKSHGNAVKKARQPNLKHYFENYPTTLINASGLEVGLPEGQMGNSEVGHTNIGAGRIVDQDLTRISKAIKDGSFFDNQVLNQAIDNCLANNSYLHLFGLLSDGGVHSHNSHLYAVLELAKKRGLNRVMVHAFMDGRDTSPTSGVNFVSELLEQISEIGVGTLATIEGRYYVMDRDKRWDRIELAYNAIVKGQGVKTNNPVEQIKQSYNQGITDEFIKPIICDGQVNLNDKDSVVFCNFRPDRARQITRAIVDPEFDGFDRKRSNFDIEYVCMTEYDATMSNVKVAFGPLDLTNTLGEIVAKNNLHQLRIAETEKYAHVTFFFNGGSEEKFVNEDRKIIQSPKVATYDLQPEMSAVELTDQIVKNVLSKKYDVIVSNYANPDMVGHTGNLEATVKALEAVDVCIKRVVESILQVGGIAIITADHGNCEQMLEEDGSPITAHSSNPVPLSIIGAGNLELMTSGRLSDIAPTILQLMEIEKPEEMTGRSLIK